MNGVARSPGRTMKLTRTKIVLIGVCLAATAAMLWWSLARDGVPASVRGEEIRRQEALGEQYPAPVTPPVIPGRPPG